MVLKTYSINLNQFLFNVRLKKQYIKKLINIIINLNNFSEKRYNKIFNSNSLIFSSFNTSLLTYIIDISFSRTNTLFHVMNGSGKVKFFYSAGSFKYKGKNKKSRLLVFRDFYRILLSKFKFLKFIPIALHFKNVGSIKFWFIKKLKKKFFIKVIKNYILYPYNGCRKKKIRRKKFKIRRNG